MRYIIAAAVGAAMSAGAAQAAVYQYDVTMELTRFNISNVFASESEPIDPQIEGFDCYEQGSDSTLQYVCEGALDLAEVRYNIDQLDLVDSEFTGSFRLDTQYNLEDGEFSEVSDDSLTHCSGSTALCSILEKELIGTYSGYTASADRFSLNAFGPGLGYHFGTNRLRYSEDMGRIFTYGNAVYNGQLGGMSVEYTMTDLDIALVPLPASLPLLGIGLAAVGFVSRRRRA